MELICYRFCTHFYFKLQAVTLTLFAIGSYQFYISVGGISMTSKTTVGITVVIFYIKGFKRILDNFYVLNLLRTHQILENWVQ